MILEGLEDVVLEGRLRVDFEETGRRIINISLSNVLENGGQNTSLILQRGSLPKASRDEWRFGESVERGEERKDQLIKRADDS